MAWDIILHFTIGEFKFKQKNHVVHWSAIIKFRGYRSNFLGSLVTFEFYMVLG
jgi:hypothetical protein